MKINALPTLAAIDGAAIAPVVDSTGVVRKMPVQLLTDQVAAKAQPYVDQAHGYADQAHGYADQALANALTPQPSPLNQDLYQAAVLPGDVPSGITSLLVDGAGRVIPAAASGGSGIDPLNQDLFVAAVLPGDVPSGITSLVVDGAGRVIPATAAAGGSGIDPLNQDLYQAAVLPGDVPSGITSLVVDGAGRVIPATAAAGGSSVDPLNQDLATAIYLERDGIGAVGADGRMLPGGLLTPSMLVAANRQTPASGIGYITGASPNRQVRAWLADGRDIAVSPAGEDPDLWIQSGDTISYRRTTAAYTGSGSTYVSTMIAREGALTGIGNLRMQIGFGQSNSVGYPGTNFPVTLAPERSGRVLMFAKGTRVNQGWPVAFDAVACLAPAIEQKDMGGNPPGETIMCGVGYQMTATGGIGATDKALVATFGVGGSGIANLIKNTSAFAAVLAGVRRAKVMADAANVPLIVDAIEWVQGEADVTGSYASYYASLNQLQTDLDTAIRGITGQAATVLLVGAQTSSWTASAITRSDIPTAILNLALAYPARFVCSGPMYPYPYLDSLHLSAQGHRNHGETIGRATARKLAGIAQPMLYAASATRSGATVTVTMAGAEGALVLDTSVVTDPGTYGIAFLDDSGSVPAISAVAVSGADTVTITLASAPTGANQRVEFGRTGTSGNGGGPTGGPRCCLRDTVAAQRADGSYLHHYACHQTIALL